MYIEENILNIKDISKYKAYLMVYYHQLWISYHDLCGMRSTNNCIGTISKSNIR